MNHHRSRCLIMARRGRKPKSVEAKEFLINNDKDFNSRGGKKGMIYSSAAKFMNTMPTGESHTYMTPVKKGERLGKGKYRIVAHYPNKQSDDRDSYESTRKSKDLVYDNDLTKPSRIKYDGLVGTGGYHLITHDRDGKRVEFVLGNWAGFKNIHGDAGFPIFAEMYLPDKEGKRSTGKKLMACPVKVGTFIVSNSHPGEMKLEATKPKGECAKFGNSNAKKHQVSPLEYETAAETEEHFMSEGELLHFYSMNGVSMDAEDLLSNYQAIDSVIVDRSSYQPAQDYGAETSFSADTLDEFCASCGEHKAEGCGGCHAAEEDSVTYSMAGEVGFEELEEPEVKAVMKKHGIKIVDREAIERVEWGGIMGHGDIDYIYFQSKSLAGMEALDSLIFDGDMKNEGDIKIVRNAEGDAATYSPSNEPDMVNEIQTEPTNANFSAESKSMFGKDKNGRMYARRRNGRIITHNAENFEGENFDEVRTGFNYGIGGYLGFTSIAVGSLMIANLIMERFGKKTGE